MALGRYYTIPYHTILYYTILYYTILYYTILYYTILYYTILYYTILYYTRQGRYLVVGYVDPWGTSRLVGVAALDSGFHASRPDTEASGVLPRPAMDKTPLSLYIYI